MSLNRCSRTTRTCELKRRGRLLTRSLEGLIQGVTPQNTSQNRLGMPFLRLKPLKGMAGTTGLEPAASAVTGQRSNQLNYVPGCKPECQTGGQCRTRTCDLLLVRQAL